MGLFGLFESKSSSSSSTRYDQPIVSDAADKSIQASNAKVESTGINATIGQNAHATFQFVDELPADVADVYQRSLTVAENAVLASLGANQVSIEKGIDTIQTAYQTSVDKISELKREQITENELTKFIPFALIGGIVLFAIFRKK